LLQKLLQLPPRVLVNSYAGLSICKPVYIEYRLSSETES